MKEDINMIVKAFPSAKDDTTMLVMLYWKFIDNIPISPQLVSAIRERGTSYDSISRVLRMIKLDEKRLDPFERTELNDTL